VEQAFLRGRFRREMDGPLTQVNLLTERGNVFAIVCLCPAAGFDLAEAHLKAALGRAPTAGTGILVNPSSLGKRCLRRRFDRPAFEDVPDYRLTSGGNGGQASMAPVGLRLPWRHAPPPLSGKAGDVFFEIHSYLRDIDGLHADEALDELCKLLYAKLYDEEQIPPGQAGRMRRGNGSSDECAADVRALYLEAAEHDRRSGEMKIPGYSRQHPQ